ncbi:MAG TPA: VOC family protein [Rhodothermales bacterium]|nr:VOC family protein [Rhodothermales bacterium]HRR08619.1 VOC family protein [Rhodothermales bacterium]
MAKPDLVGLVVQDMAQALKFYRLIGLEISTEMDAEDHVEFRTEGGFRLTWDTVDLVKRFHPHWKPAEGHRMGLAFLCEDPEEVDRLYSRITDAGYVGVRPPWAAFWGQRYAIVQDADGNLVDLFAWMNTPEP